MYIPFGKHRGTTLEQMLLDEPTYIRWMFEISEPSPDMMRVRGKAREMIQVFNEKPLIYRCQNEACGEMATRASVYTSNIQTVWWCHECNPYQRGAFSGNLQIIQTYEDVLHYVGTFCLGRKRDAKSLVRSLAQAKGLPKRVGESQAAAFFQEPTVLCG